MADFSLQDLAWLLLAIVIVTGFGPLARWIYRHSEVIQYIMSGKRVDQEDDRPIVPPVVAIPTAAVQPIVTPNSEYNGKLYDSERVVFDAKAEAVAILYQKGIATNLSKTICAVYGCSVQAASKPDSTYQQALKAVNKHLPQGAQFFQEDGTTGPATYPVSGRRSAS